MTPLAPPDDEQLVLRLRAHDPSALAALYDRHASAMLRVAWRLTGSKEDGEDVVHDVFVRLSDLLQRYTHQHALRAWLLQVTARTALMTLRAERRRREEMLDESSAGIVHDVSERTAESAELERAIAALSDGLRAVFVLRQIEGMSHEEIAGVLDISVGASRVRLARALEQLRAALAPPPAIHLMSSRKE